MLHAPETENASRMNKVATRIAGTIRRKVTTRVLKTAARVAEKCLRSRWCIG